jgi:hypothetical protein
MPSEDVQCGNQTHNILTGILRSGVHHYTTPPFFSGHYNRKNSIYWGLICVLYQQKHISNIGFLTSPVAKIIGKCARHSCWCFYHIQSLSFTTSCCCPSAVHCSLPWCFFFCVHFTFCSCFCFCSLLCHIWTMVLIYENTHIARLFPSKDERVQQVIW